jgi:hypothetical protein
VALIFKSLVGLLTVDRGVMMIDVVIVVVLFAILLIAAGAEVFSEAPRDMRDAMCFLVMLIVCVSIVLVL